MQSSERGTRVQEMGKHWVLMLSVNLEFFWNTSLET